MSFLEIDRPAIPPPAVLLSRKQLRPLQPQDVTQSSPCAGFLPCQAWCLIVPSWRSRAHRHRSSEQQGSDKSALVFGPSVQAATTANFLQVVPVGCRRMLRTGRQMRQAYPTASYANGREWDSSRTLVASELKVRSRPPAVRSQTSVRRPAPSHSHSSRKALQRIAFWRKSTPGTLCTSVCAPGESRKSSKGHSEAACWTCGVLNHG